MAIFLLCCLFSCKDKHEETNTNKLFDIFLIAGQSNTFAGEGIDAKIDSVSQGILQLGRHGQNDFKIMEAIEPLGHWDKRPGHIGFGLGFAKLYKQSFSTLGRKILLIPCGKGSSGFISNDWNKDNVLFADAVKRVNWVIETFPGSELKAVLWHQGEHDVGNENYQKQLDKMVVDFRASLSGWMSPKVFIAGGLVPYFVSTDSACIIQQNIIRMLPNRIQGTGYANPEIPFVISKHDNDFDIKHFDSKGQRELAERYFAEYLSLKK